MQGFFKHHSLGIKSWLSTVCCHTQAALLPSCGGSHRKGTGVNLPGVPGGQAAGCHREGYIWQRQEHFMGPEQEGSSSRLRGGFLLRVVQCPVGTVLTGPGALALTMLSPAAAHPCSTSVSFLVHQPRHLQGPTRVLIACDKVLTANNQHKAPVTHGSDASMSHPAPCGWASLVSCNAF